jgi:hypothetical protein
MTEGTLKRYVNDVVFWNAFLEETSAVKLVCNTSV